MGDPIFLQRLTLQKVTSVSFFIMKQIIAVSYYLYNQQIKIIGIWLSIEYLD